MTAPTVLEAPADTRAAARRAVFIMLLCTITGALAQMLIKLGSTKIGAHLTLVDVAHHPSLFVRFALQMIGNPKLFCGYAMYGLNTFLISIALKGRELSRLYPIIALTFVWVTILSVFVLGEHLNFFRGIGVAFIVGGVSVLGLKGKSGK
ncbi:MAG TPA: hypothetical protein VLJ11_17310 [Bryobacteraceae bacterium]|nr:hypothetical protein [Bryobacteraceae bacterium]